MENPKKPSADTKAAKFKEAADAAPTFLEAAQAVADFIAAGFPFPGELETRTEALSAAIARAQQQPEAKAAAKPPIGKCAFEGGAELKLKASAKALDGRWSLIFFARPAAKPESAADARDVLVSLREWGNKMFRNQHKDDNDLIRGRLTMAECWQEEINRRLAALPAEREIPCKIPAHALDHVEPVAMDEPEPCGYQWVGCDEPRYFSCTLPKGHTELFHSDQRSPTPPQLGTIPDADYMARRGIPSAVDELKKLRATIAAFAVAETWVLDEFDKHIAEIEAGSSPAEPMATATDAEIAANRKTFGLPPLPENPKCTKCRDTGTVWYQRPSSSPCDCGAVDVIPWVQWQADTVKPDPESPMETETFTGPEAGDDAINEWAIVARRAWVKSKLRQPTGHIDLDFDVDHINEAVALMHRYRERAEKAEAKLSRLAERSGKQTVELWRERDDARAEVEVTESERNAAQAEAGGLRGDLAALRAKCVMPEDVLRKAKEFAQSPSATPLSQQLGRFVLALAEGGQS